MSNTFNLGMVLPAIPEIFLAGCILSLLMVGVFSAPDRAGRNVAGLASVSLFVTFMLMLTFALSQSNTFAFPYGSGLMGEHMFVSDFFAFYGKSLILFTSILAIGLAPDALKILKINNFEYYILLLISTLGMMVLVSSQHLISFYMGLELMSFALYILVAFNQNCAKSSEAGLKYFVMGSLASAILLFGVSYIYGVVGDLSFFAINQHIASLESTGQNFPLILGLVFVLIGIAFKLSAVPFHMWTPDAYQGAPTPVTAFMSAGPKIAAFLVLLRLLMEPFAALQVEWIQVLAVLSVLTMGLGSYMAIVQTNIKRLLAYSTIGHVGFILVGVVAGTPQGVQAVLMYLTIYSMMSFGAFGMLLLLHNKGVYLETLEDFSGLAVRAPNFAFMFMILLFSIAGLPPLAGFFAKFYVFSAAVKAGFISLAVLGVLFSVVAAYYVLRLVKVMYFDPPIAGKIDVYAPFALKAVAIFTVIFALGFALLLQPLDALTQHAASSLMMPSN